MTSKTVLIILLCCIMPVNTNVITTCPPFVQEFQDLRCECTSTPPAPPGAIYLWLGFTNNETLYLPSVTRSMNGTKYSCFMFLNGQVYNESYILQIAYGPHEVTITGPDTFIAHGSNRLELTCNAKDASPGNVYEWMQSDAKSVSSAPYKLILSPQPSDDGRRVMCTATNIVTHPTRIRREGFYTLNLLYPPPSVPVINSLAGQPLKNGDVISCEVSGGKPRVSQVNFRCLEPLQTSETETVSGNVVTRTIIVNTITATTEKIVCMCSAVWPTKPEYYANITYQAFDVQYNSSILAYTTSSSSGLSPGIIVAASVVPGVVFIVGSAFVVYLLRKHFNNGPLPSYFKTSETEMKPCTNEYSKY